MQSFVTSYTNTHTLKVHIHTCNPLLRVKLCAESLSPGPLDGSPGEDHHAIVDERLFFIGSVSTQLGRSYSVDENRAFFSLFSFTFTLSTDGHPDGAREAARRRRFHPRRRRCLPRTPPHLRASACSAPLALLARPSLAAATAMLRARGPFACLLRCLSSPVSRGFSPPWSCAHGAPCCPWPAAEAHASCLCPAAP